MQNSALSNEQKKLIEDNYNTIRQIIKDSLSYSRKYPRLTNDIIDEAMGFAPIVVANEYDPTKVNPENFPKYIANICCKRMIDSYRKFYKTHTLIPKLTKRLEELKQKDIVDEAATEKLEQLYAKRTFAANKSKNYLSDYGVIYYDNMESINFDDFIKHIQKNPKITALHKKVVLEYLIPKARKEKHKSLATIAEENGCSVVTVFQLIKSDKNKELFKEFIT